MFDDRVRGNIISQARIVVCACYMRESRKRLIMDWTLQSVNKVNELILLQNTIRWVKLQDISSFICKNL